MPSIETYALEEAEVKVNFENVVGQDSLTRFDSLNPKRKRTNKKSNNRNRNRRNNAKKN